MNGMNVLHTCVYLAPLILLFIGIENTGTQPPKIIFAHFVCIYSPWCGSMDDTFIHYDPLSHTIAVLWLTILALL